MTIALCLNCGSTKIAAFSPCPKCRAGPSGDKDLDILFSDHRMSARTIEQFGQVIRAIHGATVDPDARFWVFISYVANHPSQLLKAQPPQPITETVRDVLQRTTLPTVEFEPAYLRPEDFSGPEPTIVELPGPLYAEFVRQRPFQYVTMVDIKMSNGKVFQSCMLMDEKGIGKIVFRGQVDLGGAAIIALRPSPGCLFGLFSNAPWIRLQH